MSYLVSPKTYDDRNADRQVMECGEIDFAMLLDEQRGKPLNFNFVGLYWQQVCSPYLIRFPIPVGGTG